MNCMPQDFAFNVTETDITFESHAAEPRDELLLDNEGMLFETGSMSPVPRAAANAEGTSAATSTRNVYVSQLPPEVNDEQLAKMFSPFGEIESAVVMRDIFTGISRGIAFVQFKSDKSALEAIEKLNLTTVNNRVIGVQPARKFVKGPPSSRVFIRNIPQRVTETALYDILTPFGEITWLTVHADTARRDSGPSALLGSGANQSSATRNIAFVTFSSKEAAQSAAQALHNTLPFSDCDGVPLMTKVVADDFSVKKQQRRLQAQQRHPGHQQTWDRQGLPFSVQVNGSPSFIQTVPVLPGVVGNGPTLLQFATPTQGSGYVTVAGPHPSFGVSPNHYFAASPATHTTFAPDHQQFSLGYFGGPQSPSFVPVMQMPHQSLVVQPTAPSQVSQGPFAPYGSHSLIH